MLNRQPGKALPYFLRLRRPNVFDLIKTYNLFTAVRDQALLLVEFDMELVEKDGSSSSDAENDKKERTKVESPLSTPALGTAAAGGGPQSPELRHAKSRTHKHGRAIQLLVDHSHSIPVSKSSFCRRRSLVLR